MNILKHMSIDTSIGMTHSAMNMTMFLKQCGVGTSMCYRY